ncbi:MAG: hypothetical protein EBU90_00795 [Proteobacteria bacterium]|nr:hypothetical protein [Pseudomonadota bacterium]NBP12970.1 hypothetical protein [bacterium]
MVMSEEIKNISFNDALNMLDSVSKESFLTDAWIPSLNRSIKIKEITAKQQKTILESAIDSAVSKSTFGKVFFEIITENCLEDKNTIENLTIADKASIAFTMRSQISDSLKVIFREDPKLESKVPLKDILNNFSSYVHPVNEILEVSKNGVNISAEISLPTISEEFKFDSHLYGKKAKEDQVQEVKDIITNAFLGEAAKYIKEITIDGTSLGYSSLGITQKLMFVEKLSATLVQKILEKVIVWKSDLDKVYTVTYEGIDKTIEIDNILFLSN